MEEKESYRIIDANLNRLTEGLRVIEEAMRFLYGDAQQTQSLKDLRRRVAESVKDKNFYTRLLASRETSHDPGSDAHFDEGNVSRENLADLLRANFQRAKESARVIEEYAKLEDFSSSAFKEIRFCLYELEKKIMLKYLSEEEN
jgi:hypothetical protein